MSKTYPRITFKDFCEFPQDMQEKLWNNAQDHIETLIEQVGLLKKLEILARTELYDLKADIEEIYNEAKNVEKRAL